MKKVILMSVMILAMLTGCKQQAGKAGNEKTIKDEEITEQTEITDNKYINEMNFIEQHALTVL
jgi:hypothetical protein